MTFLFPTAPAWVFPLQPIGTRTPELSGPALLLVLLLAACGDRPAPPTAAQPVQVATQTQEAARSIPAIEELDSVKVDRTIEVIEELDLALRQHKSASLQDYLVTLARVDYSDVRSDVLEARARLLGVLRDMYAMPLELKQRDEIVTRWLAEHPEDVDILSSLFTETTLLAEPDPCVVTQIVQAMLVLPSGPATGPATGPGGELLPAAMSAIKGLEELLDANPERADALIRLAELYDVLDARKALVLWQRAMLQVPDDLDVRNASAQAYLKNGQYREALETAEEAETLLRKSIANYPYDDEARQMLTELSR